MADNGFPKFEVIGVSDELKRTLETINSATKFPELQALGASDALKRSYDAMSSAAKFPGFETLRANDALRRSYDAMSSAAKFPGLETLRASDALRRSYDAMSSAAKFLGRETLGASDALKRSYDAKSSAAKFPGLETLGASDALKRSYDAMSSAAKFPGLETLRANDALRRSYDAMSSAAKFLGLETLGASDALKRSYDAKSSAAKFPGLETLGLSDELKRSLECTSTLAHGVDDAISRMRIPERDYGMRAPQAPNLDFPEIVTAPNPIWETNSHLAELTGTVSRLVEVAKQQAELTQAIRNVSDLALAHAIQSGEEAKAATQLARKSVRLTLLAIIVAVFSTLTSIGFTLYENHRGSISAENRREEEMRSRQEEIRVLRQISNQLNESSGRATSSIKPQPKRAGSAKP